MRLPARSSELGTHLFPSPPSLCWESSLCLPSPEVEVGEGRDGEKVGECLDARGEELVSVRLLLLQLLPAQNPGMSWDGRGFLVGLGRQPQGVC